MKHPDMTPTDKKLYWLAVREILVQCFAFNKTKAISLTRAYRRKIIELGEAVEELLYHDEPYEQACSIAGVDSQQTFSAHLQQYEEIQKSIFPPLPNSLSGDVVVGVDDDIAVRRVQRGARRRKAAP